MAAPLTLILAALAASHASVPDRDLATMRGGFALPGGMDVALAVQTDTSVDGALVLRTVFRADQGTPTLQVQTGAGAPGQVSIRSVGLNRRVDYATSGLDVSHLVGGSFGSSVANSVSDRTIDTVTSVAIDLHGAMPAMVGSALLRVGAIARDAIVTGR